MERPLRSMLNFFQFCVRVKSDPNGGVRGVESGYGAISAFVSPS